MIGGVAAIRRVVALAAMILLTAGLTACDDETTAEPSPTQTGPYPAAVIAPLTPADIVAGPYEDHPAVQTLRETSAILAWANLIDTYKFAQFTQYIDLESEPSVVGLSPGRRWYDWFPNGPSPEVIESVTENADGTVTVRSCLGSRDEFRKESGQRSDSEIRGALILDTTLSPLTEDEIAELDALGLEAPPFRARDYQTVTGDCDASAATVQEFENWRDYAPIGHYSDGITEPEPVTPDGYATHSPLATTDE